MCALISAPNGNRLAAFHEPPPSLKKTPPFLPLPLLLSFSPSRALTLLLKVGEGNYLLSSPSVVRFLAHSRSLSFSPALSLSRSFTRSHVQCRFRSHSHSLSHLCAVPCAAGEPHVTFGARKPTPEKCAPSIHTLRLRLVVPRHVVVSPSSPVAHPVIPSRLRG